MAVQVKFDRSKTYAQAVAAKTTAAGTIFFTTDTNDIVIAGDTYGGGGITPLYTEGGLKIGTTTLLGTETDIRVPVAGSGTLGVIALGYSGTGKNYAVQLDSNNKAYVNVPWDDNTDHYHTPDFSSGLKIATKGGASTADMYVPKAAANQLGVIRLGYTTANKKYAVQVDSNGNAYVDVPWTDNNTNYYHNPSYNAGLKIGTGVGVNDMYVPVMTSTALGVAKLFSDTVQSVAANAVSSTTGRTYGVQLNSNKQLVVNVPWTDSPVTWEGE